MLKEQHDEPLQPTRRPRFDGEEVGGVSGAANSLRRRSVRCAATEFVMHYHHERNHQGLDNKLIRPDPKFVREGGEVQRRERLGGLLKYYYKAAA